LFRTGACLIHVIYLSLIELHFAADRIEGGRPSRPAACCAEIGP
jgi:hypothetical protein